MDMLTLIRKFDNYDLLALARIVVEEVNKRDINEYEYSDNNISSATMLRKTIKTK